MTRTIAAALLALAAVLTPMLAAPALSAAETAPAADAITPAPGLSKRALRGFAFAEAHCTGCHAITANGVSPNPESPPFEEVANLPGLSRFTLSRFLRDSHNFPAAMNFTVERRQINDLASYIITLRRADYHKEI